MGRTTSKGITWNLVRRTTAVMALSTLALVGVSAPASAGSAWAATEKGGTWSAPTAKGGTWS